VTHSDFESLLSKRLETTREVLTAKNKEYVPRDADMLANFKLGAAMQGISAAACCRGYMTKHLASIMSLIDTDTPLAVWQEKIGDAINYLILLEAIVSETAPPQVSCDVADFLVEVLASGVRRFPEVVDAAGVDPATVKRILEADQRFQTDGYGNWQLRGCNG